MNRTEFESAAHTLNAAAKQIADAKRPDYTQESDDVLANFKDAARDAGIRPLQSWLVHFQKQYSAIARMVKKPGANPSEPILSRFADLRNYLDLGWALYAEWQRDTLVVEPIRDDLYPEEEHMEDEEA